MADWFVGPVMEKLINTCFEYLKDQARWQTGMKQELERLQKLQPKIQAVVFASSQAHIRDQNPALNKWIWQLRDAIDEADDVLDELDYMKHKQQLTKNKKQPKVRSTLKALKKIGKRALKIDGNLKRLEEVVQKLDKVSADVGNFLPLIESTKQELQEQQLELYKTRETGSMPKNDLIGRGKDKEFVMQWLRKPSNEDRSSLYRNMSLLSIVGHGGMGKTTLLQHVYEDEMTEEFDLKMWVCVSSNFDAKKVIADMLEYLKKERPRLETLKVLQDSLRLEVMSKKFLLVLDDIWEDEEENDKIKWENVLAPLAFGSLGSKILITTRMDSVALLIAKVIKKKKKTLRLEGLEEDECLQLLNSHAFADVENPGDHKKLRSIAGEIAKKLLGSPLAAKVIGAVLNSSFDESHWAKVLNSKFLSAELGQNDIIPILRLSYMFLPKHLQNCFAFCCIFPQDHWFDKDDLVRMWIASGFILPPCIRGEAVEDIGGRYFDVLVKKSFFDKIQFQHITYYKMHDLLHQLAQFVSAQECFRLVGDEELLFTIPETIRHLSVDTSNLKVLKKIGKFKNLRTLYLYYKEDDQDFDDVLTQIFKVSKSIRLLNIYAPCLKMIPEAIGYLIHLRYLNIFQTLLPRSLSNLYHLQFVIYESGQLIPHNFLPRDMNDLTNMHYMQLPWDDFSGMHRIGNLNSLQQLDGFYVKNENGFRIVELEHMNELRQLRIKLLENVKDAKEACRAKLYDKRNLTDLSLEWGEIRNILDTDLDEKVLDNLRPHNKLRKLRINAYMGARSAIWMNEDHLISNLECIQLDCCLEWQTLPPFGRLPFLKSLYLENMPKVKQLDNKFQRNDSDCVFASLEVLHIERLEALEDWFDSTLAAADDRLFPCLIELYLKDCPKLQELPTLPPKLRKLEIDNIGWKTFNLLQGTSNCHIISSLAAIRNLTIRNCGDLIYLKGPKDLGTTENSQLILNELIIKDPSVLLVEPLSSITSIQKLTIKGNDELVSFPVETEQWFLQVSSYLRELNFIRLKSLQSLPSSLTSLSSLKILCVREVPELQLLQNIPAVLEHLELSHIDSLECLPSSLSNSSLKYLELKYISVQKLPDLPPSLCELHLVYLHNLDWLPSCIPRLSFLQKLYINMVP
ncbi:hypothetical protein M5K25_011696 [Dendrobium thyrsiflorum]|uniref:Uncharacterized protein n=1 Tax=Dendrobium thyrsiflorum TaxID=117978 RepID=A0ABD0V3U6_DENTH